MAVPTFNIKQNDTSPNLEVFLRDDKNRPINITGAAVVFHMRNRSDNSVTINGGSVTIVSGPLAQVRYVWSASNTSTTGNFDGEFQVTFSDGTIETFPNDDYIRIVITDDVA